METTQVARKYTVMRPVYQTVNQQRRYTVMKPGATRRSGWSGGTGDAAGLPDRQPAAPLHRMKPVVQTQRLERRYTVMRPVYQTVNQQRRYTVMKPVVQTQRLERRYTVMRPVYQTVNQQRRYTVMRPVDPDDDGGAALHGLPPGDDVPSGGRGVRVLRAQT